jgi:Glyoxalase-like domain
VPTRLVHLAVDAADPRGQADFWAAVLGWQAQDEGGGEFGIEPAGYHYPDPATVPLTFVPVSEPKAAKNRVHLDLATESDEHQRAEVERLLALGARPASIGQAGDLPWVVLADPEGNEFCVLEPQPTYPDHGLYGGIVLDCADPATLARFWELAAGWTRAGGGQNGVSLRSPAGTGPYLTLLKAPDQKTVKNRIHLDVAAELGEDQQAALRELIAAGARPADVGQGDTVSWHVLTDPEGNEFCLLTPR